MSKRAGSLMSLRLIVKPSALESWRKKFPPRRSIGFVPTMGALHEGHASLIKRSVHENDCTLVSIFVNPLQFGAKEDLKKYPRPWKSDVALVRKLGVDVLFAPNVNDMYPTVPNTHVFVSNLTHTLCGSTYSRGPEHFKGVTTVVAKLFNLVRPTRAYFGMKDFQQLRVIEQMNTDLNFGITIVRCPTVREKDGLARSSRNAYLSRSQRAVAPRFYSALQAGAKLLTSHPTMEPKAVRQTIKTLLLTIPQCKIDYIDLVDPMTMQRKQSGKRPVLLAGALWLGKTRLIDNILVT